MMVGLTVKSAEMFAIVWGWIVPLERLWSFVLEGRHSEWTLRLESHSGYLA